MKNLRKKLALATCTLIAQGAAAGEGDWAVDTSYLYYAEADGRVQVNKKLANMTRTLDDGSLSVSLIHDTMSGASPTGAIRGASSSVTFSGASGGSGFSTQANGDYSLSHFEDTRVQLGVNREQELSRSLSYSYGGVISKEQDYDSLGTTLGVKKESKNRLSALNAGVAFTTDTIYRSDTGETPMPLGDANSTRGFGQGKRNTVDALLGFDRVINRHTIAQFNITFGRSAGYHTDPYKIISAADANDIVVANFNEKRPESRQRTSLFGKIVHKLKGTDDSIHVSTRLYRDDWGINSVTTDFRYHYRLTSKQYLEPHVRFYKQSAAYFYRRNLGLDQSLDPVMPADGYASADYRLDRIVSYTFGMKYGLKLTKDLDLRVRAEYIGKSFDRAVYDTNNAIVFQTSIKYSF